jgi:hypothetical protein
MAENSGSNGNQAVTLSIKVRPIAIFLPPLPPKPAVMEEASVSLFLSCRR